MKLTNIINGKFPAVVMPVEAGDDALKTMVESLLEYLGIKEEGGELCRYSDDFTLKNNYQYLRAWLLMYLDKQEGEEDVMKLLIPKLKEHLAYEESYLA